MMMVDTRYHHSIHDDRRVCFDGEESSKTSNSHNRKQNILSYFQSLSDSLIKVDIARQNHEHSKQEFLSMQREILVTIAKQSSDNTTDHNTMNIINWDHYTNQWIQVCLMETRMLEKYEEYRCLLASHGTNLRKEPMQQAVWLKDEKIHHRWQCSMIIRNDLRRFYDGFDYSSCMICSLDLEDQLSDLVHRYSYIVKYVDWDFRLDCLGRYSLAVVCSNDGRYLFSGSGSQISVWDLTTTQRKTELFGHESSVQCLDCCLGTMVSGGGDATIRVWDAFTLKLKQTLQGHAASVYCVSFNTQGNRIVSGSEDRSVRLWDIENSTCLRRWTGHESSVYAALFLDSLKVLSGSIDRSMRLWDSNVDAVNDDSDTMIDRESSWCIRRLIKGISGPVGDVRVNCDSTLVACVSEGVSITVFSLPDFSVINHTLIRSFQCRFHPTNPTVLAVGQNHTFALKLFDVKSGLCLKECRGHSSSIVNVCWSDDGSRCVTASTDGSLRVWKMPVPLRKKRKNDDDDEDDDEYNDDDDCEDHAVMFQDPLDFFFYG